MLMPIQITINWNANYMEWFAISWTDADHNGAMRGTGFLMRQIAAPLFRSDELEVILRFRFHSRKYIL